MPPGQRAHRRRPPTRLRRAATQSPAVCRPRRSRPRAGARHRRRPPRLPRRPPHGEAHSGASGLEREHANPRIRFDGPGGGPAVVKEADCLRASATSTTYAAGSAAATAASAGAASSSVPRAVRRVARRLAAKSRRSAITTSPSRSSALASTPSRPPQRASTRPSRSSSRSCGDGSTTVRARGTGDACPARVRGGVVCQGSDGTCHAGGRWFESRGFRPRGSRRRVDPSMSVKSIVTVPVGCSTTTPLSREVTVLS